MSKFFGRLSISVQNLGNQHHSTTLSVFVYTKILCKIMCAENLQIYFKKKKTNEGLTLYPLLFLAPDLFAQNNIQLLS